MSQETNNQHNALVALPSKEALQQFVDQQGNEATERGGLLDGVNSVPGFIKAVLANYEKIATVVADVTELVQEFDEYDDNPNPADLQELIWDSANTTNSVITLIARDGKGKEKATKTIAVVGNASADLVGIHWEEAPYTVTFTDKLNEPANHRPKKDDGAVG